MSDSFDSRNFPAYGGFPQRSSRRRFLAKPAPASTSPAAGADALPDLGPDDEPIGAPATTAAMLAAQAPAESAAFPAPSPIAAVLDTPPPALPNEDDDLPVLTDLAADPDLPYKLPDVAAAGTGRLSLAEVDGLAATIEASLRQQLPALIAGAVATLENDLTRGLTALVEDTVRDALADYMSDTDLLIGDEDDDLPELDAVVTDLPPAAR